jgi:hypothetical protein
MDSGRFDSCSQGVIRAPGSQARWSSRWIRQCGTAKHQSDSFTSMLRCVTLCYHISTRQVKCPYYNCDFLCSHFFSPHLPIEAPTLDLKPTDQHCLSRYEWESAQSPSLEKEIRNPHLRISSKANLTPRHTSYTNESAQLSIIPSIPTEGLTLTPIIRIMRANPAAPTRDIIPNSVTRDSLAVYLAADAEAVARVNLAHDAIASACAGAAVDVIIDPESAPLVGPWL